MDYESRRDLIRELCPNLPDTAVRRIGHATATFADVFAVAAAPRFAELTAEADEAGLLPAVDAILSVRLRRPGPSPEAIAVAWAGGLLHAAQAITGEGASAIASVHKAIGGLV
jgi:hypothetical protein